MRLVPLSAHLHAGLEGDFYILTTPEREVWVRGTAARGRLITEPVDLRRLHLTFERTSWVALSPECQWVMVGLDYFAEFGPGGRKSSRSANSGSTYCVELAQLDDTVGVRDSKSPDGGNLPLKPEQFVALIRRIKTESYNLDILPS